MSDERSSSNSGWKNGNTDWIEPQEVKASARLDRVFEVLADSRCRYLLYCLTTDTGAVTTRSELAAALRDIEEDATEYDASAPEEDMEIALHHTHLPKLAEADFIEYDTSQGTVRYDGPLALQEWLAHDSGK